jgi:hypothetical protein
VILLLLRCCYVDRNSLILWYLSAFIRTFKIIGNRVEISFLLYLLHTERFAISSVVYWPSIRSFGFGFVRDVRLESWGQRLSWDPDSGKTAALSIRQTFVEWCGAKQQAIIARTENGIDQHLGIGIRM